MILAALTRAEEHLAGLVAHSLRTWDEGWTTRLKAEGMALPPNGSLLCEPANPADIADVERRLGLRLPASYRAFLEHTDGTLSAWTAMPSQEYPRWAGFLPCRFVTWFATLNPVWARSIAELTEGLDEPDRSAANLRWVGRPPGEFPPVDPSFLRTTVQVSASRQGSVVLLNPSVVNHAGEWETWDLRTQMKGARRHPSFAAFLEAQATTLELRI